MDTGARSSRLTSSRPRGITLELTPMSFSKSQESLCTPTGQGRGAMFQRQLTPPKKEKEAQATLPLLLIWLRCSCLRRNSCVCGFVGRISASNYSSWIASMPYCHLLHFQTIVLVHI